MSDFGANSYPAEVPPTSDEKMLALVAHLGTILGGFLVPLIIMLVKKDSRFVSQHAAQSLGFSIITFVLILISIPLMCVVIGMITMPIVILVHLGYIILATIRANEGKYFEYPLSGPFVKSKFP
ncbi:DUF4870 domain-containing protein [soil metagenome]